MNKKPVQYKRGKEESDKEAEALYTTEYLRVNKVNYKQISTSYGLDTKRDKAIKEELARLAEATPDSEIFIQQVRASLVDPDDGAGMLKDPVNLSPELILLDLK